MTEHYNGLNWGIGELPIGSSTPDDLFELSFRASARCQECGNTIEGTANYWSRHDDMSMAWLNNIDYEPCENCVGEDDEENDGDEYDEE
jgi:hypothetical protein